VGKVELAFWRWLAGQEKDRAPLPRTPYWGLAPGQAVAA
jgi:hypothetical protein